MSQFNRWMILLAVVVGIWLLTLLSHMLVPFFIAAFIAYLGDPLVDRMAFIKIPRSIGVLVVFVIIAVIVAIILFLLIPMAANQINVLINSIPDFFVWIQQTAIPWVHQHFGVTQHFDVASLKKSLSSNFSKVGSVVHWALSVVTSSGMAIVVWGIDFVVMVIVAFYLMRDWKKVTDNFYSLFPRKSADTAMKLGHECNEVLGAFIRGQLMIMVALGIIYSVGLSLLGINLALLIGLFAGLLSVVPFLGTTLGLVASLVAAFVQFGTVMSIVWVLVIFAIGHVVENYILTPILIGHRIGLHPVAVIFAILAGGVLFGFFGVLLALPVAAVVMVFLRHYKNRYKESDYYTLGGENG